MSNLKPLLTSNSQLQNYGQINDMVRKLNKEQQTKVYKQAGGNAIIEGKLPYEGGYGLLFYDVNGVPNMVIGILPDGTMGLVVAKEGVNVLDVFS